MKSNPVPKNGPRAPPAAGPGASHDSFDDVWYAPGNVRAIVAPGGARMTLIYDVRSETLVQFPAGGRATLVFCPSQMTSAPEKLSQFGAHVELRSQGDPVETQARAAAFLGHTESQRQVAGESVRALPAPSNRARWLHDVIQQSNLQLLDDLRQRKVIFDGDDPDRFARWFRGTCRHAVADAIRFCLRNFSPSKIGPVPAEIADDKSADPADIAILRELAGLAGEEIGRIQQLDLREVMHDLCDGKSMRDSARRLGFSKSKVARLQKRGCRLIAARIGG